MPEAPRPSALPAPHGSAADWSSTGPDSMVPQSGNGTGPPPQSPPPADPAEPRRGWLMLAVFCFAEVTFLAVSLLVLVPFALSSNQLSGNRPLPTAAMVVALVVPTVVAALVAAGGATLVGHGRTLLARLSRELSVRWSLTDAGLGLALGAAGMILTLPASALWAKWVGQDQATSAVGQVFDGQHLAVPVAILVFFAVWLLAPLCEEILYRGVLWRAMEHWGWNRWVIFVLTTVVFSVAHLELLRTPLLLVISLPIALARLVTGNLVGSIVAHQANNLLPAVGLLLVTIGAIHS